MLSYRTRKSVAILAGTVAWFAGWSAVGCGTPPVEGDVTRLTSSGAGDKAIEPSHREQMFHLRYRSRMLDLTTRRFGLMRLDAQAEQNAEKGKRVILEEFSAPIDFTQGQWKEVFAQWFRQVYHLPSGTNLYAMPANVGKQVGWRYTFVAAGQEDTRISRYWRVFLFPHGRAAVVLQSAGWQSGDAIRYNPLLDEIAANTTLK